MVGVGERSSVSVSAWDGFCALTPALKSRLGPVWIGLKTVEQACAANHDEPSGLDGANRTSPLWRTPLCRRRTLLTLPRWLVEITGQLFSPFVRV